MHYLVKAVFGKRKQTSQRLQGFLSKDQMSDDRVLHKEGHRDRVSLYLENEFQNG